MDCVPRVTWQRPCKPHLLQQEYKEVEAAWEEVPVKAKASKSKKAKVVVTTEGGDGTPKASLTLELGKNVPAVIGKGGVVIQGLQSDTGANINIEKGSSSCQITGTPEAVSAASARIKAILDNVSLSFLLCHCPAARTGLGRLLTRR